jgi:hypothetical protein
MTVSPPWLEALREQVKRHQLPPRYTERLFQELSDHIRDIEEEKSMDADNARTPNTRMGEPRELAQLIGSEYRKKDFSRKHPVVTFAVMPILLLLTFYAGLLILVFIAGYIFFGLGGTAASLTEGLPKRYITQLIAYGGIGLPVTLTAVIFCRAMRDRGMDRRWLLLTGATLALFPCMTVSLTPSTLVIGFSSTITMAAFTQFMIPIVICGSYSLRASRLQGE